MSSILCGIISDYHSVTTGELVLSLMTAILVQSQLHLLVRMVSSWPRLYMRRVLMYLVGMSSGTGVQRVRTFSLD